MPNIEPQDCLSAILFGYHYNKPKFSIENHFNELADALIENETSDKIAIEKGGIKFTIGDLETQITARSVNIYSKLAVSKKIIEYLPKEADDSPSGYLPLLFDTPFDKGDKQQIREIKGNEFRKEFISDATAILKLIEKFLPNGLPLCKFIGIVEHYYIPLQAVEWTILKSFLDKAKIPNAINTEKIATNRYCFPDDENKDRSSTCLIFKLNKPNNYIDHELKEDEIAGASFDYQYHPIAPQNIAELGGPEKTIKTVAVGLTEVIEKTEFLKLVNKDKK